MRTRRAAGRDAPEICRLIAAYSADGSLLPRSLADIEGGIHNFLVVEHEQRVVGCGALHPYGGDLAEIRSLAVARSLQGRGAGRRLVKALLREAERRGWARVFLFTRIPEYFARLGFVRAAPERLPEKIWRDCVRCPRFTRCDETAMIRAGLPALAGPTPPRTVAERTPGENILGT